MLAWLCLSVLPCLLEVGKTYLRKSTFSYDYTNHTFHSQLPQKSETTPNTRRNSILSCSLITTGHQYPINKDQGYAVHRVTLETTCSWQVDKWQPYQRVPAVVYTSSWERSQMTRRELSLLRCTTAGSKCALPARLWHDPNDVIYTIPIFIENSSFNSWLVTADRDPDTSCWIL